MHETERALIQTFSGAPTKSFTTTELVAAVFAQDYQALREQLHSNDSQKQKQAKRHKAQLHRKLLYHLNKLLEKNILKVQEIQARGEKSYQLANTASEVLVQDKTNTITITRHERPQRFTTAYEEQQKIYTRSTALHTVDAYAINAQQYPGIAHIRTQLNHAYAHINDAICILNAQTLLEMPQETISQGIAQLAADTQDFSVAITLHIDIHKQTLRQNHLAFFRTFAIHKPKRVYIVLSATPKELAEQQNYVQAILEILSQNKIKINLHNQTVDKQPHFYGEAGAYVIQTQQEKTLQTTGSVIVANTSILINCQEVQRASEHEQILHEASKTLLIHTSTQRRIAHKALHGLLKIGNIREQLCTPTAIIRYYNFELQEHFSALLTQLQSETKQFEHLHNQIYASCGVPIDFSLQLSTGFIHYANLPARRYKKAAVKSKQDLQYQGLQEREHLLQALHTDRVRIFRDTPYTQRELFNELLYILENYRLPLISYDTKTLQTTLSLQQFLS